MDKEVAINNSELFFSAVSSDRYFFCSEDEYYEDLRQSRFGVTTKRGGWDCMRHYELAANGCVLCFRDLDLKPNTCAPHGLNQSNCITYSNYKDLKDQINNINDREYLALQTLTYQWAKNNSTVARAKEFIDSCFNN